MKERLRQWGVGLGLFAVTFVLGVYFTFPMQVVANVIEAQAEKALEYKWDIEIGDAGWAGLNGIHLRDVSITSTGPLPENEPRMSTEIDRLTVRARLLGLLSGSQGGTVDIRMGEGRLWASVTRTSEGIEVDVRPSEFPLERVVALREMLGMGPIGSITGTLLLTLDAEGQITQGGITLECPALTLGAGIPKLAALERARAFVRLPATELGAIKIEAGIADSTMTITEATASGPDVTLGATGTIELRDPVRASRVAMQVRFGMDSAYIEEASLGPIIIEVPLLRESSTPNGDYAITLSGMLGNLRPTATTGAQ